MEELKEKEDIQNLPQAYDYMGVMKSIAQNYGELLGKLFPKAFPDDLVETLQPEQAIAYLKDAQDTWFKSMEFMRKVSRDLLLGADEPYRRMLEKLMAMSSMQYQQIKDMVDAIQVKQPPK